MDAPEPHVPPPHRGALAAGLRRNAIAIISLCVALFSTSYNTWRNQTTEAHRNAREAAFKVIEQVGELREIAQRRHYGHDLSDENWVRGWGKAALIRDISVLVSADVKARGGEAFAAWSENAANLQDSGDDAEKRIADALDEVNDAVVREMQTLR